MGLIKFKTGVSVAVCIDKFDGNFKASSKAS